MAMSGRTLGLGGSEAFNQEMRLRREDMSEEEGAGDVFFHARLGADLYRRGLYAQAGEEFRRALASDPNCVGVRNYLAIALNAQGLYEDAIGELRQALEINPAFSEARANLALTLHVAGRDEQVA
jgi:Flp pilus assembly protein TadD